jgi:hypothetical protein
MSENKADVSATGQAVAIVVGMFGDMQKRIDALEKSHASLTNAMTKDHNNFYKMFNGLESRLFPLEKRLDATEDCVDTLTYAKNAEPKPAQVPKALHPDIKQYRSSKVYDVVQLTESNIEQIGRLWGLFVGQNDNATDRHKRCLNIGSWSRPAHVGDYLVRDREDGFYGVYQTAEEKDFAYVPIPETK